MPWLDRLQQELSTAFSLWYIQGCLSLPVIPSGSRDLPAELSSPTSPTPPPDGISTGFREEYKAEGAVFVTLKEIHCYADSTSNMKKCLWAYLHPATGFT